MRCHGQHIRIQGLITDYLYEIDLRLSLPAYLVTDPHVGTRGERSGSPAIGLRAPQTRSHPSWEMMANPARNVPDYRLPSVLTWLTWKENTRLVQPGQLVRATLTPVPVPGLSM